MHNTFNPDNYEWSLNGLEKCLKENNLKSKIIAKNDNAAIVHVVSYKDSQILGDMTDWCISQHKCSWEQYVSKENNMQLFIYDFNKNPYDDLSITGSTWTFDKKGICNLMCCFTRPNNPIGKATKYANDSTGLYFAVLRPAFKDEFSIYELIENIHNGKIDCVDLTEKNQLVTEEIYSPDKIYSMSVYEVLSKLYDMF